MLDVDVVAVGIEVGDDETVVVMLDVGAVVSEALSDGDELKVDVCVPDAVGLGDPVLGGADVEAVAVGVGAVVPVCEAVPD